MIRTYEVRPKLKDHEVNDLLKSNQEIFTLLMLLLHGLTQQMVQVEQPIFNNTQELRTEELLGLQVLLM